jgi:hypothetical protein
MSSTSCLATLAIALGLAALPAAATTFDLTDGNSVLKVNDTDPRGAYSWSVDGVDILYQQWFWFRVGNTAEQSLDKLPVTAALLSASGDCAACVLDVTYQGAGFTIGVKYSLNGGQTGSRTADVGEQIRINNQRNTALDFHFFQYSDFNINTVQGDTVVIDPSRHFVTQTPERGGSMLAEVAVNQAPSHAEAGFYSTTVDRLNDTSPTVLDDVLNAGPGNVTWAFEWDKVIPRRGSFLISKDKLVSPIPEPAALVIMSIALGLIAVRRRNRA